MRDGALPKSRPPGATLHCHRPDGARLGYSEISPTQDVSFTARAKMLLEVLDALGIERVDLVSNDSGGAIAQIFGPPSAPADVIGPEPTAMCMMAGRHHRSSR
jgi:hypothetical protein